MSREALRMALEALESCDQVYGSEGSYQYFSQSMVDKAITAIKQALAAPVQEPVACECNQGQVCHVCDPITPSAAQRQWVGLTNRDLDELACGGLFTDRQKLAKAIEAKLRSKNT
jgi:hypothetical protein